MFPDRPSQWLVVVGIIATISVVSHIILFHELSENRRDRKELQDRCDRLMQQINWESHDEPARSPSPVMRTGVPACEATAVEVLNDASSTAETDSPARSGPADTADVNVAMLIDQTLPDLDLSDEELTELGRAVTAIRESLSANRQLERTTENAEGIRSNLERLKASMEIFETITGMDFAAFVRHSDSEDGIDNDRLEDEMVVTEYLRDFEP